jgi:prenyltransferase beta subunit
MLLRYMADTRHGKEDMLPNPAELRLKVGLASSALCSISLLEDTSRLSALLGEVSCYELTFVGGTTYCSVAALSLMDEADLARRTFSAQPGHSLLDAQKDTVRWLAHRQVGGFQGRPGKLEDVCYSFWCGGALSVSSLSLSLGFPPSHALTDLVLAHKVG